MGSVADPTLAMMHLVKDSPTISFATLGRVFGSELPANEQSSMPRGAVVCSLVGLGQSPPGVHDYTNIRTARVDVRSYGANPLAAMNLCLEIDRYLQTLRRQNADSVLVFWVKRVSGPVQYRSDPGDWPIAVATYDILYATTLID